MNKFIISLLFLTAVSICSYGQVITEKTVISVITCGPGQNELYSAFGHNAIRVKDSINGIDYAFNYGVFDFDQPNFYLNFARGHNFYLLAVYNFEDFEYGYKKENRYIHEQVLNLTLRQKEIIYDFLVNNAQKENRTYRYDYFYNNCATKVRDVFAIALKDEVTFDGSYIKTNYSIRNLTDEYLKQQPWGDLGIDICLGLPMDKKITPYEYMFLPDYIESGFDHASVEIDGTKAPLVASTHIINEGKTEIATISLAHPTIVFTFLFCVIVAITYFDWKKGKKSRWLDVSLFGVTGLLGLLLFVLWVATDHQAAAKNYNILWALPTHLIGVYLVLLNKKSAVTYFKVSTIIYVALLCFWFALPQDLNLKLLPFVLSLTVRAFFLAFGTKQAKLL